MAKKRKSRQQKILADHRHNTYHFEAYTPPSRTMPQEQSTPLPTQAKTSAYPYLKHDLLRTITITAAILIFQILVFIYLKNHSLFLLGIRY